MRHGAWALIALTACSGGSKDDEGTDSGDGGLTLDAFADLYADAACDAQITCNADPDTIEAACNPSTTSTGGGFEGCDFDAGYAADCLEQEWTCTTIYGITYAETPSVCLLAVDCDPFVLTETGSTGDDDDTTPPLSLFDDTTLGRSFGCSGAFVDIELDFLGDASSGMLDAADTANAKTWNDHHTLDASGFPADGRYTLLSASLEVGASPADWASGVSTVFTCDVWNDPLVMTYIARAYDRNGGLADCVAWGHDPSGMVDGDYFDRNEPIAAAELDGCRMLTAAR